MGKKGLGSHADRGIRRARRRDVAETTIQAIHLSIKRASPLAFSGGVQGVIQSVNDIYSRRGFSITSEDELNSPCGDAGSEQVFKWVLDYVDWDQGESAWHAAGFTVPTKVGSWHVEVAGGAVNPSICAAWPIVGTEKSVPVATPERAFNLTPGSGEWIRLTDMGDSLLSMQQDLERFLERQCPTSMHNRIWESCSQLRRLCREDLPFLSDAIYWQGEDWQPWAQRAFDAVTLACSVEECCVPVNDLHFTHGAISQVFRQGGMGGKDLETLVEDLRRGHVDPLVHADLTLEVVRYAGKLYSLNNRRLWALQQYQLLIHSKRVVVTVRIRVLSWTSQTVIKRFSDAFDSDVDGVRVLCRTAREGAATEGVVATTFARTVVATKASKKAQISRERAIVRQREGSHFVSETSSTSSTKIAVHGQVLFGDETFDDWRKARERVQQIMQLHCGGRPLPKEEFRFLLDVFRFHPTPGEKRIDEVVSITVGSSEKFPETPAFWIWRPDGHGEDISVTKCWKALDLIDKVVKKNNYKRDIFRDCQRHQGQLVHWSRDNGCNSGCVTLDARVEGFNLPFALDAGHKLHLEWADISPRALLHADRAPAWPFAKGTSLSFVIYRWKQDGKFGCMEALLA